MNYVIFTVVKSAQQFCTFISSICVISRLVSLQQTSVERRLLQKKRTRKSKMFTNKKIRFIIYLVKMLQIFQIYFKSVSYVILRRSSAFVLRWNPSKMGGGQL